MGFDRIKCYHCSKPLCASFDMSEKVVINPGFRQYWLAGSTRSFCSDDCLKEELINQLDDERQPHQSFYEIAWVDTAGERRKPLFVVGSGHAHTVADILCSKSHVQSVQFWRVQMTSLLESEPVGPVYEFTDKAPAVSLRPEKETNA